VVRRRRMVRRFDPHRPVPEATLDTCLANAVRAPSAGFSQGWDLVVLRSVAEREGFWRAGTDPDAEPGPWLAGVRDAPVLIVCCSDKQAYLERYAAPDKGWADRDEGRWPVPYWDVDTGMAALLILLTAVDNGLGGLFFGVPAPRAAAVRAALALPDGRTVVGVVAMGYAVPGPRSPSLRRHRRTAAEVTHWGAFGAGRGEPVQAATGHL